MLNRRFLPFCLRGYHPLWPDFPFRSTTVRVAYRDLFRRIRKSAPQHPTTPRILSLRATCIRRFRLFPFRSPLLGESRLLSFPEDTEMFHFSSFASPGYVLCRTMGDMALHRFPHSEIPGSMLVSSSPRLIAAVHVLHRLPTPRHPSHALSSLTINLCSFKATSQTDNTVQVSVWSELRTRVISCFNPHSA